MGRIIKKIVFGVLSLIVVIVLSAIVYLHISYSVYPPKDNFELVAEENLTYYNSDYDECRSEFLQSAESLRSKFDTLVVFKQQVPGETDTTLFIDFCFIPASKKQEKLLILSSGTHGVEAFVGSAVQNMFMQEIIDSSLTDNLAVLLIHGVNPYGFKYLRRVTENNVDLNRNCDQNPELYNSVNDGYIKLNGFLNPTLKVNVDNTGNKFFYLKAIKMIIKSSIAVLRQAILQGQYELEDGLYFGGEKLEPQMVSMQPLFSAILNEYNEVLMIDLHTGFGERGKMHLFPEAKGDVELKNRIEVLFEGYDLDWGDDDEFYTITGDFANYVGSFKNEGLFYPMLFEFGTLNSKSTLGSIRSMHNMIIENQGAHWGYETDSDKDVVQSRFMEMYYPSSEAWRSKAIDDSREVLKDIVVRFSE